MGTRTDQFIFERICSKPCAEIFPNHLEYPFGTVYYGNPVEGINTISVKCFLKTNVRNRRGTVLNKLRDLGMNVDKPQAYQKNIRWIEDMFSKTNLPQWLPPFILKSFGTSLQTVPKTELQLKLDELYLNGDDIDSISLSYYRRYGRAPEKRDIPTIEMYIKDKENVDHEEKYLFCYKAHELYTANASTIAQCIGEKDIENPPVHSHKCTSKGRKQLVGS
jgi:hypothetical protein